MLRGEKLFAPVKNVPLPRNAALLIMMNKYDSRAPCHGEGVSDVAVGRSHSSLTSPIRFRKQYVGET